MSDIKPIIQQRVYNSIVTQILELIDTGSWKPGQKIPTERELAMDLNVGRSSVREALRILEAMRTIRIIQGDGVYISDRAKISGGFNRILDIVQEDESLADLMEARELIESQIAFLAAERATQDDIKKLEFIIQQQEYNIKQEGDGSEENIQFHMYLSEITDNIVLIQLQNSFLSLAQSVITKQFFIPGRPKESIKQHREIIQAIKDGNSIKAHQSMLAHLKSRYITPKTIFEE